MQHQRISVDALDHADGLEALEDVVTATVRQNDDAIDAHGYDPRFTPIDTLMNAPVQMHMAYGDDIIFGDYA